MKVILGLLIEVTLKLGFVFFCFEFLNELLMELHFEMEPFSVMGPSRK